MSLHHIMAATLCLLVAAATLPTAANADGDDASALPEECKGRLAALHDFISLNRETLTVTEAALLVQDDAGAVCGFDLTGASESTVDRTALAAYVRQWEEPSPDTPPLLMRSVAETLTDLARAAGEVACGAPATGTGTIDATVLGVPIEHATATGKWSDLPDELTEVTGSAALVGGTQAGASGTIYLAALPIPATGGSSGVVCAEIVEVVKVERKCINLIFYIKCTEEATVETRSVTCGAVASQNTLALLKVSHEYTIKDAPAVCDG